MTKWGEADHGLRIRRTALLARFVKRRPKVTTAVLQWVSDEPGDLTYSGGRSNFQPTRSSISYGHLSCSSH